MSPDPVARSTIRVRVCGLIQRRMKFRTRRWLPNHRLSCRSRSRSRSNSAEIGCGRSIISNTAGSKLRFIEESQEGLPEPPPWVIQVNRRYPKISAKIRVKLHSRLRLQSAPQIRDEKRYWSHKP